MCRCIQPWPRDIFVWQTASIVYYTFQSVCPLRIYFICQTDGRRRLPFEDFAIFSYGEWTRKGTEVCAKIKSRWWRSCSGGCRCRTGRVGRSWAGARVDTGRVRAHDIVCREENDDKCNYMMWSGNIALVVATFCNASLWLLLMGRMKILNKPIVSSLWSLHIRDFNFDNNIVMNTQYCLEQLIALSHTLRI